jgi:hypothetical protein
MERPIPIESRKLQKLFAYRTKLQGELAEVEEEIQRIQMGNRPQDIFWKQTIDFNQTRKEQARYSAISSQNKWKFHHTRIDSVAQLTIFLFYCLIGELWQARINPRSPLLFLTAG